MRPFLRWAGGKRWLNHGVKFVFEDRLRLIEPFLGGGAFFFSSKWRNATLSDVNPFLINAYCQMRDRPRDLYELCKVHFSEHSAKYYYRIRDRLQGAGLSAAADFIYLNRTCFNGVFRVNSSGKFNVPIGSRPYRLECVDEFLAWSDALGSAEIVCRDFEDLVDQSTKGDIIFADPPYTVSHNNNGFIEYNEKLFKWSDQIRLRDSLVRAAHRGARFIVTNADHGDVRELYNEFLIKSVMRGSTVSGNLKARGKTTEVIIVSDDSIKIETADADWNVRPNLDLFGSL